MKTASKEQFLRTTDTSIAMALLHAVLVFAETIAEDRDIPFSAFSYSWRLEESLLDRPRMLLESGEIRGVYSSMLSGEETREVEIGGRRVTLVIGPGYGESSIRTLYTLAPRLLRGDRHMIRERAEITTRTGVEYMFFYLTTGDVAVFEGEHHKVKLPFVESAATVHTHPEGACALSLADVRSGLDLLASGGLLAGAATPSCLAFMLRVGMVSEEDYFVISEALYRRRLDALPRLRLETVMFRSIPY